VRFCRFWKNLTGKTFVGEEAHAEHDRNKAHFKDKLEQAATAFFAKYDEASLDVTEMKHGFMGYVDRLDITKKYAHCTLHQKQFAPPYSPVSDHTFHALYFSPFLSRKHTHSVGR